MKRPTKEQLGGFFQEKGFYIVLFLCAAAIGISGYYLFFHGHKEPDVTAGAPLTVTVTPRPVRPTPMPVPSQAPTPGPTAVPTPRPTVKPKPKPKPKPEPAPAPAAQPEATSRPASAFTWPLKGEVLVGYTVETLAYDKTMGDWRTHAGVDLAAPLGAKVLSVSAGTVQSVRTDDLMGTVVTVDHGDGLESIYANLSPEPLVSAGDEVRTGEVLGSVGETAIAESAQPPHLHFAMHRGGVSVDPADFLP